MEQIGKTNQSRKIRRTPEEINSILLAYESSGLSAKEFCKRHQIQTLYLKRWLKRYRSIKETNGFVELLPVPESTPFMTGVFAEYRGIRFYQPVEPSYLKALVN
jgi:putative transposase